MRRLGANVLCVAAAVGYRPPPDFPGLSRLVGGKGGGREGGRGRWLYFGFVVLFFWF